MQLDALPCPECAATVATPFWTEDSTEEPDRLFCPACGHRWVEADARAVAQAWRSLGAYEARVERGSNDSRGGAAGEP